jgi:hypothetical protein
MNIEQMNHRRWRGRQGIANGEVEYFQKILAFFFSSIITFRPIKTAHLLRFDIPCSSVRYSNQDIIAGRAKTIGSDLLIN